MDVGSRLEERNGSLLAGVPVRTPDAGLADFDAIVIASIGHGKAIETQIRTAIGTSDLLLLTAHHRIPIRGKNVSLHLRGRAQG